MRSIFNRDNTRVTSRPTRVSSLGDCSDHDANIEVPPEILGLLALNPINQAALCRHVPLFLAPTWQHAGVEAVS